MNLKSSVNMTVLNAVMADFSYANHAHEEYALGVTLEGLQDFSFNGCRFRSRPGNIIFFNPGDVHNGHPGNSDALKYTMFYVDPSDFQLLLASAATVENVELQNHETNFSDAVLSSMILRLTHLVSNNQLSALESEQCLYEIAKRLTQRMGIFYPDSWKGDRDSLLLKARDFIHDNIVEDISIDDLSQVANISKFHFIRLFRSQFGLTPHQYILNHRINRVREALKAGGLPTDIAQQFGFFDVSHMNRHFKRSYGITPRQYQYQLNK
ncbi:AraC family transcriptional regulator [Pseudodesulfovibrio cashew]|uniref:AraC family transcriptional regulator n=2 Tax=Pseudodesulfovibrio cashew TaxID=2678688 RepID=A0A6I6JGY9_9BACT|nr:AraC family transcriptional regulator [Pseudodesulfovibrio cashew]